MTNRFFIELTRAWQIATGYPLPRISFGKQTVTDRYLAYFPVCGFAVGLAFFLSAKLFQLFEIGASGTAVRTLCAMALLLLGEAITHGEGLACLSVLTGRRWKQLDKTVFCINQYRDFSIASILYVLLRFLSIMILLQAGHPEYFMLIFTASYCGRIELGFAKTELKRDLFAVSYEARKTARLAEIISFIVMLMLLLGNGVFLVIIFYLVASPGIHYYLLSKQIRDDMPMSHALYQAIAYGLETALLFSAALVFPN